MRLGAGITPARKDDATADRDGDGAGLESGLEAGLFRLEFQPVLGRDRDKLRVRVVQSADHATVHGFLGETVDGAAEAIYTDSHKSYRGIGDADTRQVTTTGVNHSADEWVRGDVHTNTIESAWSLFDRAVIGSYHKLSAKHLPAYLKESSSGSTIVTTPSSSGTRWSRSSRARR